MIIVKEWKSVKKKKKATKEEKHFIVSGKTPSKLLSESEKIEDTNNKVVTLVDTEPSGLTDTMLSIMMEQLLNSDENK